MPLTTTEFYDQREEQQAQEIISAIVCADLSDGIEAAELARSS